MSTYEEKAIAKCNLEQALVEYKEAADKYGMDQNEIADEISDCLADAMLADMEVVLK